MPTPFGIATTEVIPIREIEGVSDKIYLFYYLLVPDVRSLLTGKMQGTTGRLRLGTRTVADLEIPLPPLAEQHRIVVKLETLFTQLDAAVDNLKKAQRSCNGIVDLSSNLLLRALTKGMAGRLFG